MIAQLDSMGSAVFTLIGALGALGGVGLSWLIYTVRDDRRRAAEPRHLPTRPHTAGYCGTGGDTVEGGCVSNDGHLYGLCPGCGQTDVSCSIIDPNLPFGPWVIDDHEPRIDPDLGLHGGECWTNKTRTGDYGLCVCGRVDEGVF
jgi:hypothetical protein